MADEQEKNTEAVLSSGINTAPPENTIAGRQVGSTDGQPGSQSIHGQAKTPGSRKRIQLPQAFSSFRHRNYQLWFGGQLVSLVGTWMQIIAEGWLVYQISHSEFALGMVSFASAVPFLFVSPWAGVVVDRVPKRTLLVVTQLSAMLLALLMSTLVFTGAIKVWHIVSVAAVLGIVSSFDAPARQALVVDLVGKEDLPNAIALNSMMFNGARVIGPALGGLLLALIGPGFAYLLNGLSYIAVIAALLAMTFPVARTNLQPGRPLQQFLEGIAYARAHREIFYMLVLAAIFSIFGSSYGSILPAFIDQVLHSNAAGFGTINASIGAGALIGALIIAQYSSYGLRGRMLSIANMVYPFLLAVFAFNSSFVVAMLLGFSLGLGFMLIFNNVNSLLQLHVEDQMRGRIMSLYTLSFFGFSPFGSLAMGAVAERIPISLAIAISAGITFLLSIWVYYKAPGITRLR